MKRAHLAMIAVAMCVVQLGAAPAGAAAATQAAATQAAATQPPATRPPAMRGDRGALPLGGQPPASTPGQPRGSSGFAGSRSIEAQPLGEGTEQGMFSSSQLIRTVGPLALVVGVIVLGAKVFKRFAGGSRSLLMALGPGGRAPSGVVEVLARYPAGRGQTVVLLKVARRVMIVCQTHGKGGTMRTLSELSDPEEVADIIGKTRDASGESSAAAFRQTLKHETELLCEPLPRAGTQRAGADGVAPPLAPPPVTARPVHAASIYESKPVFPTPSNVGVTADQGLDRVELSELARHDSARHDSVHHDSVHHSADEISTEQDRVDQLRVRLAELASERAAS